MKTNWQDPQTSEIRSTHIAGLMDAVGKIEDVLDLKLQAETNVPLTEVYISELDRYRIYQAPAGKRNWASSPAPVIKKNGVVISSGFTIDYGGGAIVVSPSATSTDTFTADVSYTKTADNALESHKAETAYKHINESGNNENGRYLKFDDGTLVIWKMIQQTVPASSNDMYPFTFPASFIYSAIGSINITAMLTTASVDAAKAAVMRAMPTSGSMYSIGLKNDAASEQTITFYVIAIGRWK